MLYSILPHYLIKVTVLEKKKKGIEYKMCVLLLSTNFALDMFSFEEELGEI